MATLEKIRSKSVLLFVIIIVALLAFILGDFLTSGRTYFGQPTTVAKANGVKVEYQDYQNRMSEAGEQLRNQGREYSSDALTQQVVQDLLTRQLLDKEYDKLGITVTDSELTDAMTGANQVPAAAQMVAYLSQQLGLPEASASAVFDAMQNPAKYGLRPEAGEQLRNIWAQQEKELEEQMKNQKFMSLVSGLYTYNNVDAKNFYDDNATTRHITYATKNVSAVTDDEVNFSDADIRAYWNEHKNDYRLDEETREVQYIYVPIEPSQADRVAGQQAVENAILALNEKPGTEGVASDTRFVVTPAKAPAAQFRNAKLRTLLEGNEAGHAELLTREGDLYTIVKILDITTGIDSINISMLQAMPEVSTDSLLNLIKGGATFASLSNGINVQGQDSIWTALEVDGIKDDVKKALETATIGSTIAMADTIQGTPLTTIYKVNRRHAPVKYYDIATIEYTVDPSNETLTDLTGKLRTFVSNHSSAADFAASAADEGYSVLSDEISVSSVALGNAAESRKFIKWAMDAKKGQVSPMMQDDKQSYLIAVAVKDIYNDYLPADAAAIAPQMRMQALNAKKAAKLAADYSAKGNSVADYAKAMEVEVQEGDVNIISPAILNLGVNESAVQGAIAAADKGQLVGPVQGNRGIIVFEVQDINTDNRPFNAAEYGQRFMQNFGFSRRQSPLPLLLGKGKIENRSLNFVQSPVE